MTRNLLPLVAGLLLTLSLHAEGLRPPAQQAAEMRKIEFLIGKWSGQGWVMRGQRKYTFKESKTVSTKMKRRIFIIEGTQTFLLNDRQESQPIEMLAILSYDEKAASYQFRTHLANGYAGDHSAKMIAGGILEWEYNDAERGRSRYRIRLDEKQRWLETGEFTTDGKTWEQFYENILVRSK